ncbi:MAG: lysophospholipid acyltransferase family protein [Bellilinea sp.]
MNRRARLMNWFLRLVFRAVCRIDLEVIKKIPTSGPLIVVCNHINFLEAPVLLPHLDNPVVTSVAKKESWKNPLFKFLFDRWEIIPIDRDAVDREAFRRSLAALDQGKILVVFPEGTRSKDGRMLPGKPGVVTMVMRSGVSILPVGFHGYENFWENLKRLRATDFHIALGTPFHIHLNGDAPSRDVRQAVTDEIMYKIAELLPERYRGHYQFNGAVNYRYAVAD